MSLKVTKIEQRIAIPATPDEIFKAFMDPKTHSAFTGSKATGTPEVGGKFSAWDGYISGKNLELEKGKKIVQEWKTTDWPDNYPPSKLEFTFNRTEKGTQISMVHSNVPAEQAEEIAEGWNEFYWRPMKDYFMKRVPKKDKG
jgi:activator of HSP90 ATPase